MILEEQPTVNPESHEKLLSGKVALITGSSRDIGAETAKALAKEGINIVGNYREKQKRANMVQQAISILDVKSEFVQADITIEDDRKKLLETVRKSFDGKLDFLVLNASGPSTDLNVTAANALVDMFLPALSRGKGSIVLMQSVPGHYQPEIDADLMPESYAPVAKAKYEGEQSLRKRMKEFEEKNVSFIIVCPPEVIDTPNIKYFNRKDPQMSQRHAEISRKYRLPEKVTKEEVGKKIAELLKMNLPMGYTEFFKGIR